MFSVKNDAESISQNLKTRIWARVMKIWLEISIRTKGFHELLLNYGHVTSKLPQIDATEASGMLESLKIVMFCYFLQNIEPCVQY